MSLKGKISFIYSTLLDQPIYPLTPLKNIRQKDLACDFSDDQLDIVYQNVFTSLSSL